MQKRIENGKYNVKSGWLLKRERGKEKLVANFHIRIVKKLEFVSGDGKSELIEIAAHIGKRKQILRLPLSVFHSNSLEKVIATECGFTSILYGSAKDLRNAAMEFLEGIPVEINEIFSDLGFSPDGKFYSRNIFVDENGVFDREDQPFKGDAHGYIRNLGFKRGDKDTLRELCHHLLNSFLELKRHAVMYPLMGHICLAPFSSLVIQKSIQKPMLHLVGQTGSGKTFLGGLAASFFGTFQDVFLTWDSTVNSLEQVGYVARDHLVLMDDYCSSDINYKKVKRIIHGHSYSQGRSRTNATLSASKDKGIRGLILSTGEDFPSGRESVFSRVILLNVESQINDEAGMQCLNQRDNYRIFMPYLLHWYLSKKEGESYFFRIFEEKKEELESYVEGVPNGLRIISNWALNSTGFTLFVNFLKSLKVLTAEEERRMLEEYDEIVKSNLVNLVQELKNHRPMEVLFDIISTEIRKGNVQIVGLNPSKENNEYKAKVIGKVMDQKGVIALFHRETFRLIKKYFQDTGKALPFTIEELKEDLEGRGILERAGEKRKSAQVRLRGDRFQAWFLNMAEFKKHCCIEDWEKEDE